MNKKATPNQPFMSEICDRRMRCLVACGFLQTQKTVDMPEATRVPARQNPDEQEIASDDLAPVRKALGPYGFATLYLSPSTPAVCPHRCAG